MITSEVDNIWPIKTTHSVPLTKQCIDEMRTNEASSTQYQRTHDSISRTVPEIFQRLPPMLHDSICRFTPQ